MALAIWSHPACLAHDPGPGHPERPARLQAVLAALDAPPLDRLPRFEAPRASLAQLARVHDAALIRQVLETDPDEHRWLDPDTVLSPGSAEAALRAAGAGCAAVDQVLATGRKRAFCAVRPPGHHATRSQAMGFCLFNNVAVAAAHALAVHGLKRVAIMDFDVHHGNGSQDIFETEPRVLYASTHQAPLYPGTGARAETGCGNLVNVPLRTGAGAAGFRGAMDEIVLPAIDAFAPQLLLVSAGFDAHAADPLANLDFTAEDFAWATRRLVEMADIHAGGRVVSMLEGGYALDALAASVRAHAQALAQGA